MKTVLLLLTGNVEKILLHLQLSVSDVDVVKIDDKIISDPKAIRKILTTHRANQYYIGTANIEYQRFLRIWNIFFHVFGVNTASVVDEFGTKKNLTISSLLTDIALLMCEVTASCSMLIVGYLYFGFLKYASKDVSTRIHQ